MTEPLSSARQLQIGSIVFPNMDQADFTGPFEILSRLPDTTFHVFWKDKKPVRDMRGLILTPEEAFAEAGPLDLFVVPGGQGVNALMEDEEVLAFVRKQAAGAKMVLSVCTGGLLCGAAGLLRGRRATTHWAAFHLLEYFGAIPVNKRVVIDENFVSAAGVTAGFDAAFTVAAMLRGRQAAEKIQLYVQYAPEPPFQSGSPETAPPDIAASLREDLREIAEARLAIAKRVAAKLGQSA